MSSRLFIAKRVAQPFMKNMIGNFAEPKDLASYQKMLTYRCNNLGMKELDHIIGGWAKENLKNLSLEECRRFEEEVLDLESPDIYNLALKKEVSEEFKPYLTLKYIQELRNWALFK